MSETDLWFDEHHTYAAASIFLLTKDRRLVLQLRDDKPDIENPGRITSFGGSAEPGETPVECALRELAEETGIRAKPADLLRLGTSSKPNLRGHPTALVFFLLREVDPAALVITEGTAIELSFAEAAADSRLTETCRRFCAEIAAS